MSEAALPRETVVGEHQALCSHGHVWGAEGAAGPTQNEEMELRSLPSLRILTWLNDCGMVI